MSDINIDTIADSLNNKVDLLSVATSQDDIDFVVEWQKPTAENSYTWYRKYKSGWVEQGGCISLNGQISETNKIIKLPVEMAYSTYFCSAAANANVGNVTYIGWEKTTEFSIGINVSAENTGKTTWFVCGMAA